MPDPVLSRLQVSNMHEYWCHVLASDAQVAQARAIGEEKYKSNKVSGSTVKIEIHKDVSRGQPSNFIKTTNTQPNRHAYYFHNYDDINKDHKYFYHQADLHVGQILERILHYVAQQNDLQSLQNILKQSISAFYPAGYDFFIMSNLPSEIKEEYKNNYLIVNGEPKQIYFIDSKGNKHLVNVKEADFFEEIIKKDEKQEGKVHLSAGDEEKLILERTLELPNTCKERKEQDIQYNAFNLVYLSKDEYIFTIIKNASDIDPSKRIPSFYHYGPRGEAGHFPTPLAGTILEDFSGTRQLFSNAVTVEKNVETFKKEISDDVIFNCIRDVFGPEGTSINIEKFKEIKKTFDDSPYILVKENKFTQVTSSEMNKKYIDEINELIDEFQKEIHLNFQHVNDNDFVIEIQNILEALMQALDEGKFKEKEETVKGTLVKFERLARGLSHPVLNKNIAIMKLNFLICKNAKNEAGDPLFQKITDRNSRAEVFNITKYFMKKSLDPGLDDEAKLNLQNILVEIEKLAVDADPNLIESIECGKISAYCEDIGLQNIAPVEINNYRESIAENFSVLTRARGQDQKNTEKLDKILSEIETLSKKDIIPGLNKNITIKKIGACFNSTSIQGIQEITFDNFITSIPDNVIILTRELNRNQEKNQELESKLSEIEKLAQEIAVHLPPKIIDIAKKLSEINLILNENNIIQEINFKNYREEIQNLMLNKLNKDECKQALSKIEPLLRAIDDTELNKRVAIAKINAYCRSINIEDTEDTEEISLENYQTTIPRKVSAFIKELSQEQQNRETLEKILSESEEISKLSNYKEFTKNINLAKINLIRRDLQRFGIQLMRDERENIVEVSFDNDAEKFFYSLQGIISNLERAKTENIRIEILEKLKEMVSLAKSSGVSSNFSILSAINTHRTQLEKLGIKNKKTGYFVRENISIQDEGPGNKEVQFPSRIPKLLSSLLTICFDPVNHQKNMHEFIEVQRRLFEIIELTALLSPKMNKKKEVQFQWTDENNQEKYGNLNAMLESAINKEIKFLTESKHPSAPMRLVELHVFRQDLIEKGHIVKPEPAALPQQSAVEAAAEQPLQQVAAAPAIAAQQPAIQAPPFRLFSKSTTERLNNKNDIALWQDGKNNLIALIEAFNQKQGKPNGQFFNKIYNSNTAGAFEYHVRELYQYLTQKYGQNAEKMKNSDSRTLMQKIIKECTYAEMLLRASPRDNDNAYHKGALVMDVIEKMTHSLRKPTIQEMEKIVNPENTRNLSKVGLRKINSNVSNIDLIFSESEKRFIREAVYIHCPEIMERAYKAAGLSMDTSKMTISLSHVDNDKKSPDYHRLRWQFTDANNPNIAFYIQIDPKSRSLRILPPPREMSAQQQNNREQQLQPPR